MGLNDQRAVMYSFSSYSFKVFMRPPPFADCRSREIVPSLLIKSWSKVVQLSVLWTYSLDFRSSRTVC